MNIPFVKYRKIYFIFSGILLIGSLVCLIIFGLKLGIDFTGGSILELEFKTERPSNQEIRESLKGFDLGEIYIQPADEKGLILRMKDISEDVHQQIIQKLKAKGELEEKRFESIGPVIGQELKEKAKLLIVISLLSIVFYIAIAFRRVQKPLSSWQYGIASLFILSHDILIPLGVFALLGKFYQVQLTIPIICAFLTIVGYAINNVVVVYDRLRENLLRGVFRDFVLGFEEATNKAINQTLTRQLNTSLTTLFPLIAIFFLGGETLKYFALTLILGITAGTYSSIFLAIPILVSWLKWRGRKR
ncbi:MAG: protein translocase subunit SecF [Candidatus Nealsonbacteria bacterium CG18_big_fil_WC_8_21_14_2_50_37_10]|uniref:Protein-export membrane protein SecF n=1 Tax=Candidatus Nealsonbacteria bacterium CG18_big_fil_WC_8_21_14_2_50_37_10 TaxID=1974717 RepID=A0A2H0FIC0_9BACT|nr:MAG: protein translocase subunit SecF [Candidatus Nealsonbacteria bacterium CG18_big_fil_WC_8_21_14_2_50_37_10]